MAKQSNITSVANKFEDDFNEFTSAIKSESGYDGENYNDILQKSKLTSKGMEKHPKLIEIKGLNRKIPPPKVR